MLLLKTVRDQRQDRDQGGERLGGDTGEEVVKYSGRGVDTMGGIDRGREEAKQDKEGTGKGICEELKSVAEARGRSSGRTAKVTHEDAEGTKRDGGRRAGRGATLNLKSHLIRKQKQKVRKTSERVEDRRGESRSIRSSGEKCRRVIEVERQKKERQSCEE